MQDQTGQINNLTVKYIMELSKLKPIQRYMTTFELNHRIFERHPQIQQLSLTFILRIKEVFENLEKVDIYMTLPH